MRDRDLLRASEADVARMRAQIFVEEPDTRRKLTRFWLLLVLAAVIASGGVVGDSTATVIGAMIVAPLMGPILGVVVATVLGDHDNLLRSAARRSSSPAPRPSWPSAGPSACSSPHRCWPRPTRRWRAGSRPA